MTRIKRYLNRLFHRDYPERFSDFVRNSSEEKKIETLKKIVEESDRDQRKALGL